MISYLTKEAYVTAEEVRRHQLYLKACREFPVVQGVFQAILQNVETGVCSSDGSYPVRTDFISTYGPEAHNHRYGTPIDRWAEIRAIAWVAEAFGYRVTARYGDPKGTGSWFPWEHLDTMDERTAGADKPLSYKVEW